MEITPVTAAALVITICSAICGGSSFAQTRIDMSIPVVHVDITPGHAINSFDPDRALGSSLDVLSRREIDKVHTPHIVQESLSAGWGPITYRNNSELRMGTWHWTENGVWSDALHQSGYFTGSTALQAPIRYILSYALPHRGFASSEDHPVPGPNLSYWKSNPYLTRQFTGEADALHPQWVIVDMRAQQAINAVYLRWVSPFAKTYQVEYWVGTQPLDFGKGPNGAWQAFESGAVNDGQGGAVVLPLAATAVTTRYLRILMRESSNTCNEQDPTDVRNCVGYALQAVQPGTLDASGKFTSAPKATAGGNFAYHVSSIDPWHSAEDVRNDGEYQHTGFDLFFTSGITNNLPATIPVTMLYGTPENAAAQIAYLLKRDYPIAYIEMGEEPDGQHMLPEDYAALYIQWAKALHNVDPTLQLGGPIFEGVNEDLKVWPDAQGRSSWMGRFVAYLQEHGHLADLAFVSFEHYPFKPCTITWSDLYREPQLMQHILQVWRADGVPAEVPLMVTESHLAAYLTGPMSTIFAGLWLADNVGAFFEGGGSVFHHSPIQPQGLGNSCMGWATWSNFVSNENDEIKGYTATYYAARMINLEWVAHRSGTHQMVPTSSAIKDADGNFLVTSYALHRPDGNWSLMLVNRDEQHAHIVRVSFDNARNKRQATFAGPVRWVSFGSEQYAWINDGLNSHPDPNAPPVARTLQANEYTTFVLPKASLTVIRGRLAH